MLETVRVGSATRSPFPPSLRTCQHRIFVPLPFDRQSIPDGRTVPNKNLFAAPVPRVPDSRSRVPASADKPTSVTRSVERAYIPSVSCKRPERCQRGWRAEFGEVAYADERVESARN
mgnify:CR=1 FL=1